MQNILNSQSFSFWELNQFFHNIDLVVVGSGIVGLNAAISFKRKHRKAKVLVLERGTLPLGGSTKNAGFACFGSISELLSDIQQTDETTMLETVEMRYKGLRLLRERLGDKSIDYKAWGGYELFDTDRSYNRCKEQIDFFNKQLASITGTKETYKTASKKIRSFGFQRVKGMIYNTQEGQIDTGRMMHNLLRLSAAHDITVMNNLPVMRLEEGGNCVRLQTAIGELRTKHLIVATNGFAAELLDLKDVQPARAQVLITAPLKKLSFKGCFHYNEGYYYFRNIHNRILLGGGRNLDFKGETTTAFALNPKIQHQLDHLLQHMILPGQDVTIEHRWCGIMGIGSEKKPIIRKISPNIVCAVRMGGMGVAIGSLVGKLAVKELIKS